jgi:hypothetical protein
VRQIHAEKSPDSDLPFYVDFATGDAALLYVPLGTEIISLATVTDWNGAPLADLSVTNAPIGAVVALRVAGGVESATPYKIKVSVFTTPNGYTDEVFIELWVRRPTPSPVA